MYLPLERGMNYTGGVIRKVKVRKIIRAQREIQKKTKITHFILLQRKGPKLSYQKRSVKRRGGKQKSFSTERETREKIKHETRAGKNPKKEKR